MPANVQACWRQGGSFNYRMHAFREVPHHKSWKLTPYLPSPMLLFFARSLFLSLSLSLSLSLCPDHTNKYFPSGAVGVLSHGNIGDLMRVPPVLQMWSDRCSPERTNTFWRRLLWRWEQGKDINLDLTNFFFLNDTTNTEQTIKTELFTSLFINSCSKTCWYVSLFPCQLKEPKVYSEVWTVLTCSQYPSYWCISSFKSHSVFVVNTDTVSCLYPRICDYNLNSCSCYLFFQSPALFLASNCSTEGSHQKTGLNDSL